MGFIEVGDKLECIECGTILTNEFMKPRKLKIHQSSRHSTFVGKDKVHFDNQFKKRSVKLASYIAKCQDKNDKVLIVSFTVAEMISKVGAPQSIGEKLLKFVLQKCSQEMLNEESAKVLKYNTIIK